MTFKNIIKRFKDGEYIYFVKVYREKIFAKGLTKKEYQKRWCRSKK